MFLRHFSNIDKLFVFICDYLQTFNHEYDHSGENFIGKCYDTVDECPAFCIITDKICRYA